MALVATLTYANKDSQSHIPNFRWVLISVSLFGKEMVRFIHSVWKGIILLHGFMGSCNIFSMQLSLINMRVHSFHPASFYILIWCSISRTAYCSPVEISRNIFEAVKILITVCIKCIKNKLYSPLCFPVLDALL